MYVNLHSLKVLTEFQLIFILDAEGIPAAKKRRGKGSAYQTISATHKVQVFLFTPLGLFSAVPEFHTNSFPNDDALVS